MEEVFAGVFVFIWLSVVVCILASPAVVFYLFVAHNSLAARVRRLEEELRRTTLPASLPPSRAAESPAEVPVPQSVAPPQVFVAAFVPEDNKRDDKPESPAFDINELPNYCSSESQQVMELLIGRHIIGWVAAVIFILAVGFFIREMVVRELIGPAMQVSGVVAIGLAMVAAGWWYHRLRWIRFSHMLTSTGVTTVFLAAYASYSYYQLISLEVASFVVPAVVVAGFLLAWWYETWLLGTLAVIGGLSVPFLLVTPNPDTARFFAYLLSLNVATVVLLNRMLVVLSRDQRTTQSLPSITGLAVFGTQFEFIVWHFHHYTSHDFAAVCIFQIAFFATYLANTALTVWRPMRKSLTDETTLAVTTPLWCFGSLYFYTHRPASAGYNVGEFWTTIPERAWIFGLIALGVALFYAAAAWFIRQDKREDRWHVATALAVSLATTFLAVAILLVLGVAWVAAGWGLIAALLWLAAISYNNTTLRSVAATYAAFAAVRLFFDIPIHGDSLAHWQLYTLPIFNTTALPFLVCSVLAMSAAAVVTRWLRDVGDGDTNAARTVGILGWCLLLVLATVDIANRFYLWERAWSHNSIVCNVSVWAIVAVTVLWWSAALATWFVGFRMRSKIIRRAAWCLASVAAVKVFTLDVWYNVYLWERNQLFVLPFVNLTSLSLLILATLCIAALFVAKRFVPRDKLLPEEWTGLRVLTGFGAVLLWATLSIECFLAVKPIGDLAAQMSLSIFWSLFAGVVMALGFWRRVVALRWSALALFTLTVIKVFVYDLGDVDRPYRIAAFLVLSIVLGLVSYGYQRFRPE
ncbi:MAG: DUF2339 domain-containing protein [Thermoguttaceae bacterium]